MTISEINLYAATEFTKEINFLANVVPAIQRFEEIENVPQIERIKAFPRYFGSRLSLNSSKVASNLKQFAIKINE